MAIIQKSAASLVKKGVTEHVTTFDSLAEIPALVSEKGVKVNSGGWAGGLSQDNAMEFCRTGNASQVAKSDEYLTRLEGLIKIDTHAMRWQDNVSGSIPNVPAYIAGHPLSMRRRTRESSEFSPLAIVIDTTISAGINKDTIQKRGAAILALVRLLGFVRPVELYVACGVGTNAGGAHWIFARINTSPLDLASAGFALCHPAFPRGICYEIARRSQDSFNGHWPYNEHDKSVKHFHDICQRWLPHMDEFLALPGVHYNDPATTNPEQWIKEKLAIFAPMVATE